MAEFGVRATELSPPQGAGAVPVETRPEGSALDPFKGVISIFANGLEGAIKDQKTAFKNSIVSEYAKKLQTINDAVASGAKDASWASVQIKRATGMYGSQYPQFIDELKKTHGFFVEGTEVGSAMAEEKAAEDLYQGQLKAASDAGYTIYKGASKEAQVSAINAHKAEVRSKEAMDRAIKQASEYRSQATFDQAKADKFMKDASHKVIVDIASANLTAFHEFSRSLGADVRSGKIKPEEAQVLLSEKFSRVSLAIDAASGVNKDLAAPYTKIFGDMNTVAQKLIDPATQRAQLDDELKIIMTRAQLAAVADPRNLAAVVSSQWFGAIPGIQLEVQGRIANIMATISKGETKMVDGSPVSIIGTDNESDVIKTLTSTLNDITGGKYKDKTPEVEGQVAKSVDVLMREIGGAVKTGHVEPRKLDKVFSFVASPQFLALSKGGKLSPDAAKAAKEVYQLNYVPIVEQGVQAKLQENLYGNGVFTRPDGTRNEPWEVRNFINISMEGGNVKFTVKDDAGLSDGEKYSLRRSFESLKSVEAAVSHLVKAGANLEQDGDYAKFFERNKHIYFPNQFSAYEGLEIGDIVDGKRFVGGNPSTPGSWKEVKSGTIRTTVNTPPRF